METSGPHTCLRTTVTQDHPNLTSHYILELIKDQIVVDPTVKEKVLMVTVKSIFGYQPGRKKIRDAKKLAMDEEHDSWEGSYEDLPFLMEVLQCFNVGSKIDWVFKEDGMEDRGSLELTSILYLYLEHEVTFKRLFWVFKPCIDGVRSHETHIYGPYPSVLLSVVAVDGFSHILSLAFSIVESENDSSWGWFMDRLRKFVAAYDGGKCYGMMTTNHAESWNNAILDVKKLPISSLVRSLFLKTVEYFDERRLEISTELSKGRLFTNHASKRLSRSIVCARGHSVKVYDRNSWLFEVVTRKVDQKGGNKHTVRIPEYLCSCGKWQAYRIPCSHVIACCAHLNLSHELLVDEIYRFENVSMVYNGVFEPIPSKRDSRWPTGITFPTVIHDKDVEKKKKRRKSTSYQNAIDFQAPKGKNELF
ncbi:uncharacterized protein LOC141691899 [Apium graveolens]|uniref:uncharacterized protein LOC141691899 n=1 Tax=Apium graveolens TaxID=4045 RepID=UPI003D79E966